ncbi:class D sortase [Clostridium tyrobutyricum]|uniref:class D sortase n=1 Tax=Clostridium tyrobutyricum TaxID=1519 RepID=UPI001C382089|nr:class D sortase [Clostridium tyrobutyricum]MBV4417849.1 class D sortase [Clostridium tyrobutyricum]
MKNIKIISTVLIVSGIALLLYTFGAKYLTVLRQNNMVKNYEQEIKKYRKPSPANYHAKITNTPSTDGTIGILVIPKIDLKVTIGEGTDMRTLKYAVGHFKNTAMPGQKGNFALAGHRSYTYGQYFNRLGELKNGDEIYVETINKNYKYTIYSIKVVLPNQIEVLNPTKDSTITLVTCTPIRIATHRLIIKAKEKSSL